MKKFLLLLSLSLTALAGMAQTQYTEKISVTLNGDSFPDAESTITVTKADDGTCEFTLPNFILPAASADEEAMYVGNINLKGVPMTEAEGYTKIATKQVITIAPGNLEGVEEFMWLGPFLGDVPIELEGKLTDTNLYATIHINYEVNNEAMEIDVVIGNDPQAGIGEVSTAAKSDKTVYNLKGMRVADAWNNALPKGIYIVGGKKVIK